MCRLRREWEFAVDPPAGIKIAEWRAALATESSTRVLNEILFSFSVVGLYLRIFLNRLLQASLPGLEDCVRDLQIQQSL